MRLPIVAETLVPLTHRDEAAPPAVALSVFCTVQSRTISVETCVRCSSCVEVRAVPGGYVDCRSTNKPSQPAKLVALVASHSGIKERAAALLLGEIVDRNAVSVLRSTQLESVSALFLHGDVDCAPVVDGDGGLIGIISKSDLLRHVEKLETGTVGDIMTPCVHALPEDSTLAYAFALMAFEKLQYVPVVSKDGKVVGLLTTLDVLRWVTDEWGFVSFMKK